MKNHEYESETKTAIGDYEDHSTSVCLEWLAQLACLSRDQLIRRFRDEYVSLPGTPCVSLITQFWANSYNDKNRYRDIPCLDKTRVRLKCSGNDYIHANWIDSPEMPGRIIMTQAPMVNTANDFWRMVMGEKVNLIVALTKVAEKGVEKSFAYWPMEMGPKGVMKFQNYVIRKTGHQNMPGCCISILEVTNTDNNERLKVKHLLYLDWPDHKVPKCTHRFMALVKLCAQLMRNPISVSNVNVTLIHCSAGVGRSGTLTALLMLSSAVDKGLAPNVQNTVKCLREQRAMAVQGLEQYAFIYRSVMEMIWVKEDMSEEVQTNAHKQIDLLRSMTTKSTCDLSQLKPRNVFMSDKINVVEQPSPLKRPLGQSKGAPALRERQRSPSISAQRKRRDSGLQAIKNIFANKLFQKGRRRSRTLPPPERKMDKKDKKPPQSK
uniref:Tyrosine-protein phosphatase domain-containing protein n=2 Tax=Trichuris muris TaxID=70415 RepID=A0A5S6R3H9_TRIMR